VADEKVTAATQAAAALGVTAYPSVDALLADKSIELVHIATPPHTHAAATIQALEAGKHVLIEKPLATTVEDAKVMIELAKAKDLLLAVNLIMRYNPLTASVKTIIDSGLLGRPLHAIFENYASDEDLPPGHWFWDKAQSGGIFIEHGVHFFDLFEWWFGGDEARGRIECAQEVARPDTDSANVDQVQATVRYGEVLANFYHGFTQARRMDRQEMRIVFEDGDLRLFEWVPTRLEVDMLGDANMAEGINRMLPHATTKQTERYASDASVVTSHNRTRTVDGRYQVSANAGMNKQQLYGHIVRALLDDQISWIHDRTHRRLVTEQNGLSSLVVAVRAEELANRAT
jgi:predicted dehydrogenase